MCTTQSHGEKFKMSILNVSIPRAFRFVSTTTKSTISQMPTTKTAEISNETMWTANVWIQTVHNSNARYIIYTNSRLVDNIELCTRIFVFASYGIVCTFFFVTLAVGVHIFSILYSFFLFVCREIFSVKLKLHPSVFFSSVSPRNTYTIRVFFFRTWFQFDSVHVCIACMCKCVHLCCSEIHSILLFTGWAWPMNERMNLEQSLENFNCDCTCCFVYICIAKLRLFHLFSFFIEFSLIFATSCVAISTSK